jgi:ankyrin repeat protein
MAKMGAMLEKVREKKAANAEISAKACQDDARLMFLDACKRGDAALMESMLAAGGECEPSLFLDRDSETTKRRDLQGKLPLTLAASRGHAPCVAMLLEKGGAVSHPREVVGPLLAALGSPVGAWQHEQGASEML